MDQRFIFIFHNYEINEGKIKQRKNYVYRDWKSGKIAIGFSYVSFTRTISLSLSLFLSFSLFTLLFNFLFHSSFFLLFFSTFFLTSSFPIVAYSFIRASLLLSPPFHFSSRYSVRVNYYKDACTII